jgi:hypothetical protein
MSNQAMRTQIILLFGPSGTGKSTLTRLLAGRLPQCAFIEVNTPRYMIVGGLMADSGGTPPSQAPEEYERQCCRPVVPPGVFDVGARYRGGWLGRGPWMSDDRRRGGLQLTDV